MSELMMVTCDCGKQVKIKKYQGKTSPYKCNKCRGISHKFDSCLEIDKDNNIKRNGYILRFCRKIHQFTTIKGCKFCKDG